MYVGGKSGYISPVEQEVIITEERFSERIAKLEADEKNIFHQLDEIKHDMRDIRRLCTAVEKIAVQTENTAQKVDGISARLETVEHAPMEDIKHYKRILIGQIITAVTGALLGGLLALLLG